MPLLGLSCVVLEAPRAVALASCCGVAVELEELRSAAFPENVARSPARACNTLEGTLNISVITLINKIMAPRVGEQQEKTVR